jgi:hypothetical protein
MSVPVATDKAAADKVKQRQPKTTGGAHLLADKSRDTRRLAAAILEVLAGARTPTEAATALGLSLPRYYQMESRALEGLLQACAPKPRGPGPQPAREVDRLRADNQRLQRELTRQQSLARTIQRTANWTAPPTPGKTPSKPAKPAGKKPRRARVARALSLAARLQDQQDLAPAQDAAAATVAPTSTVV